MNEARISTDAFTSIKIPEYRNLMLGRFFYYEIAYDEHFSEIEVIIIVFINLVG